ncbi:MAG: heme-dependent peroxidase [Gorillibacterium sp.]|nr:heme-dependent peroxidase [Gorillibacterium sp.]
MNEVIQTFEGWYSLHDFRTINWSSWKYVSPDERAQASEELATFFHDWKLTEDSNLGSSVVYSVIGQKADLVFMHLRETLEELEELKIAFNKTTFAEHTLPAYSYVSVVEVNSNMTKPDVHPLEDPDTLARLKPILPAAKHICFYPMNKRRQGGDNWYMLSMDNRASMMRRREIIGGAYTEQVIQIITGSIGLDDWEWGVTLFADDPLQFKKLVSELRFDEVDARYSDYGDFFVGNRLDAARMETMLKI